MQVLCRKNMTGWRRRARARRHLKSKITETAKPEYLAGSDADRQQMEKMLLALKDADGEELYTEKNFAQWVEEAEKKAEEGPEPDPYAAVR